MINKLAGEISSDPLGRGYSAMNDRDILLSLTTPDRVVFRDVAIASLAGVIEEQALVPALREVPKSSPVYPVAEQLLRFVVGQTPVAEISYSNPSIRARTDAGIGGLAAMGVISQSQAALILGLGRATVSRADELGLFGLTELQIKEAR